MSGIKAYLHCKSCKNGFLEVGLADPETVIVNCSICDQEVTRLKLTTPIPMRCDVCDEPIGENHTH